MEVSLLLLRNAPLKREEVNPGLSKDWKDINILIEIVGNYIQNAGNHEECQKEQRCVSRCIRYEIL